MSTWISKAALAFAGLLALPSCEDGGGGGLLAGLSLPLGQKPAEGSALAQTKMASGAFTLVPPQGFCIDGNTLQQRFALMARCDVLGAPSRATGAPVGIITVSVTPLAPEDPLPTPEATAEAAGLDAVDAVKSGADFVTYRAEGTPPANGLDKRHWRAKVRVGDQVMGVALYGPEGQRAVSAEGREILNDLVRRTREASRSQD